MKPPDLVHELERRTAAGEVAPIPDRNRRGYDRSLSAALAQLRLRETKPDLDPVPRMLAEVRRVFVECAICSRPEALSRILPGDSFETLLATRTTPLASAPRHAEDAAEETHAESAETAEPKPHAESAEFAESIPPCVILMQNAAP